MTTDNSKPNSLIADEITSRIIGAIYEVHSILGPGFLETVYQKALVKELRLRGVVLEEQKELRVLYKGEDVGLYFPDILVEGEVIVELKAVDVLKPVHQAQLLNYLKATGIRVGLLVNFGTSRAEFKRLVL
ncbi:MAG: GxxExxY protein [Geobacter sp.]|nr:GxxExxY protein [Geobacter sp.]